MIKNYYEFLEVSITASPNEIKKAYRQKAVKYHPDKHFGDKYFSEKFIEIKEAYDILSDSVKKEEYDILYKEHFVTNEPQARQPYNEAKRKEKEKEEQFYYDPYKPFYSYQDRINNETPQFNPRVNHWGEVIAENVDFFRLPKNIGKIVSGFSSLTKEMKTLTQTQIFLRYVKIFGTAFSISAIITLIFSLLGLDTFWLVVWAVVPWIIAIWYAMESDNFKHTCNCIGVNGFAMFECLDNREKIVTAVEINFKDITDLLRINEVRKMNFNYANTAYNFIWMKDGQTISETSDLHYDEKGNPERFYHNYWINHFAERYWTVYLLDNMEKELDTKGHLEFRLLGVHPYIHLGIGFIKFLYSDKDDTLYNFNEIKRAYIKGTNLFIEHTNYEKKFFFFESGNKNGIPLLHLANRQFFFRAMELLLGIKFSS